MKQALADKNHPEHKTYRQWLGLKRGEQFDSDCCWPGEINRDLRAAGF